MSSERIPSPQSPRQRYIAALSPLASELRDLNRSLPSPSPHPEADRARWQHQIADFQDVVNDKKIQLGYQQKAEEVLTSSRAFRVKGSEEIIELTRSEWQIIHYLATHTGELIGQHLLALVINSQNESYAVEAHLSRLRHKLGDRWRNYIQRPSPGELTVQGQLPLALPETRLLPAFSSEIPIRGSCRWLTENDAEINLTPIETDLLNTLYDRRGRGVPYSLLQAAARIRPSRTTPVTLRVHIGRLRRKLEASLGQPGHKLIVNLYNAGYYLPEELPFRRIATLPEDIQPAAGHFTDGELLDPNFAARFTPTERRFLDSLETHTSAADQTTPRQALQALLRSKDHTSPDKTSRTVSVIISKIRKKLPPDHPSQTIVTVRGIGYKLTYQ